MKAASATTPRMISESLSDRRGAGLRHRDEASPLRTAQRRTHSSPLVVSELGLSHLCTARRSSSRTAFR